ncbi:MAG: tRNA pseudouridine(38-40) synthase TruA [Cytophagaceae bacterium]
MRYFLEIAYKGTNYAGWQIQKNAFTVQQELNEALQMVFRNPIKTIGSGRTDTGVHAPQQFVHLDLEVELTQKHIHSLNCILSDQVAVRSFIRVKDEAHARFDALSRAYEYKISTIKDPFNKDLTWFFDKSLDVHKMNEACAILQKHKDFQAFSKVHTDVNNYLCDIFNAEWFASSQLLVFKIEANRFLRGMVRAIGGTMLEVGLHRLSLEEFEKVILIRDRAKAGNALPPQGLHLMKISYPDDIKY